MTNLINRQNEWANRLDADIRELYEFNQGPINRMEYVYIFGEEHYRDYCTLFGGRPDQFPAANYQGIRIFVRSWATKPILLKLQDRGSHYEQIII